MLPLLASTPCLAGAPKSVELTFNAVHDRELAVSGDTLVWERDLDIDVSRIVWAADDRARSVSPGR